MLQGTMQNENPLPELKRFSMNLVDTLESSDPLSWTNVINPSISRAVTSTSEKRYSNINTWIRWIHRLKQQYKSKRFFSSSKSKRFSMNHMDTLDPGDPNAWSHLINKNKDRKKQSNNLDRMENDPDSWITKGKEPICDCTAIFEKIVKKCRDEKFKNIISNNGSTTSTSSTTLMFSTPHQQKQPALLYNKLRFDENELMNLVGGDPMVSPKGHEKFIASKYNGRNFNSRTFGRNLLYPAGDMIVYPTIPAPPPIPKVVRNIWTKKFRFL